MSRSAPRRSRFADDVDPDAPLPEYPRPQLRRPDWSNLNGWWDLALVDVGAPQPVDFPSRILVPFPIGAVLSQVGHTLRPDECAWMRRRFTLDPSTIGGRLRLHFGAVDWECTVYLNGVEVGSHRGGYDPFHLDVTDALATGGEQEIVLRVWDPTDDGHQPVGKQSLTPVAIWYPAVAGIWQTVWLEPVPTTCIERVVTTASLDAETITVTVGVSAAERGDSVRLTAMAERSVVGTAEAEVAGDLAEAVLAIPGLRVWSPEDPFLHDLGVEIVHDGVVVDSARSYFGAREVALARDAEGALRLVLNGECRFHLGLLDQGWWPDGLYSAPTDAALAFDIEAAKAMGFNVIRKHVKVEPARWYWHADRLGMLVWQDMPSTRVDIPALAEATIAGKEQGDVDWNLVSPAGDPTGFRRELDAIIDALEPFPSIVVWVPFNEGWGQHDTAATLAHVSERDPSRLVDGPSGWVDAGSGDVRDHHMYDREEQLPGPEPSRAVVYGEFGGYKCAVENRVVAGFTFGYGEAKDADALARDYATLLGVIAGLADRGLAGAIYTQTTDVEGEINGMLTYDREVAKIPFHRLREIHEPLTARRWPIAPTK